MTDKTTTDKIGRVVWHDLFTNDRPGAMSFYGRVAGWEYKVEHATDFAWGGGAKDFVLALSAGEAGAGIAETPPGFNTGWIAYVEVPDVDAAAALAETSGGAIVRRPFDVPGVGRNAVVRDPFGAVIGLSVSQHDFPVPKRQFGIEIYRSDGRAFPLDFYTPLLGWTMDGPLGGGQTSPSIAGPSGDQVAVHLADDADAQMPAVWVPSLNVADPLASLRDAEALGGRPLDRPAGPLDVFVADPQGATFWLAKAPFQPRPTVR